MKRLALALAIAAAPGLSLASSPSSKLEKMLERIDPSERFIQACSYAAAERIGHDGNPYHPDRAVMDSISPPVVRGNLMKGTGGAFRSGGAWYQFSFDCAASPDHMKVLSFDYRVGAKIPEDKWEQYGLWR